MDSTARNTGKHKADSRTRLIGFALTTALAGIALSGCATNAAAPAAVSASKAEAAMAKGKFSSAIGHGEAAVLADPRNPAYRATLGAAYLDAGRFASAAASFTDAMALGDKSGRTVLSLALALTADGKSPQAVAALKANESSVAPSDLGLAYALAGEPGRGVFVLSNALREGENTPKVRQNLAYAYALSGQWREARLMAAEDVPADQISDRIAQWATDIHGGTERTRVAVLLSVPTDVVDPGQPVQLALANFPEARQLAGVAPAAPAQALAAAPAPARPATAAPAARPAVELPAVGSAAPVAVASAPAAKPAAPAKAPSFQTAFPVAAASPSPSLAVDTGRFVQSEPARVAASAPVRAAPAGLVKTMADGSHLIQLGSFSSEAGARRAWGIYTKRYPELSGHEMVITQAVVRGKNYWRVAAAGFDAGSSRSMCGKVTRSSADGCLAYSRSRPLPGAVDTGRRLASR